MNVSWNEEDSTLQIEWNPNDPLESVFNDWTEQDFIDCIMKRVDEVLGPQGVQNCTPAEASNEPGPETETVVPDSVDSD